jgi:hypothetical protein
MAIGLGLMFGFKFLENFNYPLIASSITDFWRRWHMSLGSWFRDYVYIPLGGNRVSKLKLFRNIFVVWFLTGFWHGAAWNFIIWGLYFGVILVIEKFVIASPFFGRDVYRMYIRVGLKAKMPEAIRLTDKQYDKRLGDFQVNLKSGNLFDSQERNYSEILEQREFKGGYPFWKPQMSADFRPDRDAMSISYLVKESLGEAIVNDKKTRTVVLEFKSIQDAIRVLNLLPFGLNYKIYILDA